ncbi:MAG: NYN domain-containing protein [Acidimicrobiia bacterium]|nr:NYN domain-containing protein [Acidimicrobiia bacterium]
MSDGTGDRIPFEFLVPGIEAARAALRRLKEDDVPARLRKVASYSGGRLPAPLAKALVAYLDGDDWLREKALKELDPEATDSSSGLFLRRPDGWLFEIGKQVGASAGGAAAAQVTDLERRLASAAKSEAEARRRLDEAKAQLAREKERHRGEVELVRGQLREVREADRREDDVHTRELAELEAARSAAQAAHEAELEAGQALKERLRRAEEQRAEVERRVQAGTQTAWGSGDPVALARHLDTLIRTVEADPALLEFTQPTREREWKLPPGARPDQRNAIDWLMRQPRPFTCIVDGYNLTHRLSGGTDSAARERLNDALARFKLRTRTPAKVIVVYDSAVSPEIETGAGPGGVWVRFTREGLIADEEIRRLAEEADDPVVVVSSDREVREGSEKHGAIGLWGEALAAWIQER